MVEKSPRAPRRKPPASPAPNPVIPMETGIALLLGEINGQMRELIQSTHSTGLKIDALAARVAALEAAEQRRQGASSVLSTILKSPALGWLVGAAITAWALLTGKVHP